MAEVGQPLPKFGEWDVNDPASAEGFTVIFNKARNEKKTGGTTDSPPKADSTHTKTTLGKPQSECIEAGRAAKLPCSSSTRPLQLEFNRALDFELKLDEVNDIIKLD